MARVLIVDDHAVVRKGLQDILKEIEKVTEVKEAINARQALDHLQESADFAAIILDVSLSGDNGIELLREIRTHYPEQKVLILSQYPEEKYGILALKAGASGYLNKNCSAEELKQAASQMVERGRYISQSLAEVLAETASNPIGRLPHELLSEREYQTFIMIASGLTPSEIAEAMKLSVKTISVYRTRLLDKMKLKNTAALVHYARNHHLVESLNN